MEAKEIRQQARDTLRGNWRAVALATVIVQFITMLPSFFKYYNLKLERTFLFVGGEFHQSLGFSITGFLLNVLITIPIVIGLVWTLLCLLRKEPFKISNIFIPFRHIDTYLRIIFGYILVVIFILMWSLGAIIPFVICIIFPWTVIPIHPILIVLCILLFIIPGIIKTMSYSQTFFILKDHPELSPPEAIIHSRKLMKGYKRKFFLLNLSFIGWAILSGFTGIKIGESTFYFGYLLLLPYIFTSQAIFYERIRMNMNS